MCTLLCVCPPKVESLFPLVLSKSCNQIRPAFKVWFSRNSSSHCQSPWLGSLTWCSEPSLQWVDFRGISVLQFVSHPPSIYGIWFYCDCAPPTISLWLLLCLWMLGIIFGDFQCLPVDDCSAVSCDTGALARGSEGMSFFSTVFPISSYISSNIAYQNCFNKPIMLLILLCPETILHRSARVNINNCRTYHVILFLTNLQQFSLQIKLTDISTMA